MSEPTPAEQVVAILKRELPGFAAEFHAETDRFRVRGPIFFSAYMGVDIRYAVPEVGAERMAAELVDKTRRHGIEALGLETMIREELQRARHAASVAAFAEGKAAGIAQGRREMLAEVIAARSEDEAIDRG